MENVDSTNFTNFISADTSLVQFSASWCGPCKILSRTMNDLAPEFSKTQMGKIDIEESMEIANKFNIRSVPVVILFENGQEKARTIGAKNATAMREFIKENL